MHPGRGPGLTSRRLGQRIGVETVTLSEAQIPSHGHMVRAMSASGATNEPTNQSSIAAAGADRLYTPSTSSNIVDMASQTMSTTGGGQSHDNLQPYLVLNFIIALQGLYPSRG